jgi:predicted nucleic acid-binding protein
MLYPDTSLLVAALTAEEHTDRAQRWLSDHAAAGLVLSAWTHVEVAAALAAKLRAGQLEPPLADAALSLYDTIRREQARDVLPVSAHFRRAAEIAANRTAGVRGGDALHLAIAAEEEARLCTLDQRQAEAARVLGFDFVLI